MRDPLSPPYRLATSGGDGRHPYLSDDGAFLADGTPLLTRTGAGEWRPRQAEDVQKAAAFTGSAYRVRAEGLATIARALNQGQPARAAIALLHLRLPPLPGSLAKGNTDQPRVPAGQSGGGQWTSGGGGGPPISGGHTGVSQPAALLPATGISGFAGVTAPTALGSMPAAGSSLLEGLTPEAILWLAARASAPTTVLGILLIPTNGSHIVDGTVPGHPDLNYRVDEGILSITQSLSDGGTRRIFLGGPDKDHLYRLPDGTAFGRILEPAMTSVAIDGDALTSAVKPIARTADIAKDEPKLCPDPGPDVPGGTSARAVAYQQQITGLPPGYAVALNGVIFDGCRLDDGTMLEAKGPGYAWAINKTGNWYAWFRGVGKLENQMDRQWAAAGARPVAWYFAEDRVAQIFRNYARDKGYASVSVIYEPPALP